MRPSRCAPAALSEVRLKSALLQVIEDSGGGQRAMLRRRKPPDPCVTPPPAQLSSRILPVGLGHGDRELVEADVPADVCQCLRIPDTCKHRRRGRYAGFQSAFGLGDQPALHLPAAAILKPPIDDL